jgi:hypothetical protein
VQRLADLLVRDGLAAYQDNPAHRRAKLLRAERRCAPSRRRRQRGPTRWAPRSGRRISGRPASCWTGCCRRSVATPPMSCLPTAPNAPAPTCFRGAGSVPVALGPDGDGAIARTGGCWTCRPTTRPSGEQDDR